MFWVNFVVWVKQINCLSCLEKKEINYPDPLSECKQTFASFTLQDWLECMKHAVLILEKTTLHRTKTTFTHFNNISKMAKVCDKYF